MRKNVSGQRVSAQMIAKADGTEITTGPVTVNVTKDGVQTPGVGTVSHIGSGLWEYLPTQSETNGNHLVFTFSHASGLKQSPQVYTVSYDPHNITNLGLGNLDTNVSSRLESASYTAPDNNAINLILSDTNELQSNQGNWMTATGFNTVTPDNDGILNAIANLKDFDPATQQVIASNMRGTDNALLAVNYTAPNNAMIDDTNSKVTSIQFDYSKFDYAVDQVTVGSNNDKTGYTLNGEVSANIVKINGNSIIGDGSSGNLWRGSNA